VADVTAFVAYFCEGMAAAFAKVRRQAETANQRTSKDRTELLRSLNPQQRTALGMFRQSKTVTSKDVAHFFKLSQRMAYLLCARWVKAGFLEIDNPSTKARSYRLAKKFESLVGSVS
jgi:hypothetical protein